jgi:hypothetical protein
MYEYTVAAVTQNRAFPDANGSRRSCPTENVQRFLNEGWNEEHSLAASLHMPIIQGIIQGKVSAIK